MTQENDNKPLSDLEKNDEERWWPRTGHLTLVATFFVLICAYWLLFPSRPTRFTNPVVADVESPCLNAYIESKKYCDANSSECNYWQDALDKCMQAAEKRKAQTPEEAKIEWQKMHDDAAKISEDHKTQMAQYNDCIEKPEGQDRDACLANFAGPVEEGRCRVLWERARDSCANSDEKKCNNYTITLDGCRREQKSIDEFNQGQ